MKVLPAIALSATAAVMLPSLEARAQTVEDPETGTGPRAADAQPSAEDLQPSAESVESSVENVERSAENAEPSAASGELRDLPAFPERLGAEHADAEQEDAPLPVTRFETLLELDRLSDAERYTDALPLAERLITLTEQELGERGIETANAYATAARVQRDAGEHELAERNYLHAIELYREAEGPYTERAIEPLIGLGDSYSSAGQHLNAITVYDEARTINRRVFGLLNEGQVPILDRITGSFQSLNQYAEADEQQLTILNLAERNYPEGSPEHLEALYRYAGWLRESGRYHEERQHYARAMRLIRDMHGKDSLLLVRAMREVANSFREQRLPDNQGPSSLRSALEVLDANGAPNALMRAEVLRDIGDWEVAFSNVEPNLEPYRDAWTLLGEVENGETLRREWFQELQRVLGEPVDQRGISNAPEAVPGYVIVIFDVDRFGRTADVRSARSDPAGLKDDAVVQALRRWRFRPHIEAGTIVSRDNVALRFNYRYLPADEEAEEQAG